MAEVPVRIVDGFKNVISHICVEGNSRILAEARDSVLSGYPDSLKYNVFFRHYVAFANRGAVRQRPAAKVDAIHPAKAQFFHFFARHLLKNGVPGHGILADLLFAVHPCYGITSEPRDTKDVNVAIRHFDIGSYWDPFVLAVHCGVERYLRILSAITVEPVDILSVLLRGVIRNGRRHGINDLCVLAAELIPVCKIPVFQVVMHHNVPVYGLVHDLGLGEPRAVLLAVS